MATIPIKVPSVGESVTEGILARWLKPDGAVVKPGDPLFEFETDKASQEVQAERGGTLRITASEGTTVSVGATVGSIDTEAAPTAAPKPVSPSAARSPATKSQPKPDMEPPPEPEQLSAVLPSAPAPPLSPAVRRLVAEERVDLETVTPSGPGGRITKGDVLAAMEQRRSPTTAEERAVAAAPPPTADRAETRQRLSGIRQRIAQRLVESQRTTATLTTFNEADLSRVLALRAEYKEAFQKKHGIGLGFLSFFVKAAVEALKAFPPINGRLDGNELVLCHYYDIGVAVSTERGLMVPVLRDADRLSFAEIERSIAEFATKARDNTISVADLQGGTFTITNGGVFGSLLSTPILNPPQSAILGMHKIQERPVVLNGQIVARPMMYLALSYDHRIIDGREAVSFLVKIKESIESPERLLLGL